MACYENIQPSRTPSVSPSTGCVTDLTTTNDDLRETIALKQVQLESVEEKYEECVTDKKNKLCFLEILTNITFRGLFNYSILDGLLRSRNRFKNLFI